MVLTHWQFKKELVFRRISVRAGPSGFRDSVRARNVSLFQNVQIGPGTYQASYSMSTGFLPGGEAAGT